MAEFRETGGGREARRDCGFRNCGLRIRRLSAESAIFRDVATSAASSDRRSLASGAPSTRKAIAKNRARGCHVKLRDAVLGPSASAIRHWQFYAMMIWLLGTLILGIWLFLRLHRVAGRQGYRAAAASLPQSFYNHLADCAMRLGLRRIPRVVVTKRLTSPAVFGVFSPVLLVPKGYLSKLSRRDTEHMLLHELAHIKRGDLVMHGLYMLLQIVYWYNPLLWLVRRHMHHLRELSCDGTVAELLRERTPAYRQTLLETARRMLTTSVEPGLGLLGLFEDSNHLLVRLNWLTKPTWRYSTMKRAIVATIAVLMFACVLPMAQGQESASPEITKVSNCRGRARPRGRRQPADTRPSVPGHRQAAGEARTNEGPAAGPAEPAQGPGRAAQSNAGRAKGAGRGRGGAARRPRPSARESEPRAKCRAAPREPRAGTRRRSAGRPRGNASGSSGKQRAQAESRHRQAWDVDKQDWAKSMQAYGDQMKQWEQSDQMKKWREEMAKWGQKMGSWGQELASRQTGAAARRTPSSPQMPPDASHAPDAARPCGAEPGYERAG